MFVNVKHVRRLYIYVYITKIFYDLIYEHVGAFVINTALNSVWKETQMVAFYQEK